MSFARLGARVARLHPFTTRYASNLAILFGVVYFAQGMWHLPRQSLVIALKDGGLSAVQVAMFFSLSRIPWLIKPVYGLLSDSVPLFGRRRKSSFVRAALLASGRAQPSPWRPSPRSGCSPPCSLSWRWVYPPRRIPRSRAGGAALRVWRSTRLAAAAVAAPVERAGSVEPDSLGPGRVNIAWSVGARRAT